MGLRRETEPQTINTEKEYQRSNNIIHFEGDKGRWKSFQTMTQSELLFCLEASLSLTFALPLFLLLLSDKLRWCCSPELFLVCLVSSPWDVDPFALRDSRNAFSYGRKPPFSTRLPAYVFYTFLTLFWFEELVAGNFSFSLSFASFSHSTRFRDTPSSRGFKLGFMSAKFWDNGKEGIW